MKSNITRIGRLAVIFIVMFVTGCAQIPTVFNYQSAPVDQEAQVWPDAPEQARYRYVGQLTGEENFSRVGDETKNWGFKALRWLVGLVGYSPAPVILQRPQAVVVDSNGRIYVSDVSRGAVYVFDKQQAAFHVWEYAGLETRFELPIGMAIGAAGELYVADASLKVVAKLDSQGSPLAYIGLGELEHPTGLAADIAKKLLYVADRGSNSIKVFNFAGEKQFEFGTFGEQEAQLNGPTYLFLHNEQLYVTDTLNSRIQIFSGQGEYIRSFGRRGLYLGDLPRPKGVAVDRDGNIYVVESYYDYLLVFNRQGELLLPIGGTGYGIGQFYLPSGVWVENNYVYVADTFNGRVMIFEYLGDGDGSDVTVNGSTDIDNAAGG